jgi:hypothetical protein
MPFSVSTRSGRNKCPSNEGDDQWVVNGQDATLGGRWYPCPSATMGNNKSVTAYVTLAHPGLRFNTLTLSGAESSILGYNSV